MRSAASRELAHTFAVQTAQAMVCTCLPDVARMFGQALAPQNGQLIGVFSYIFASSILVEKINTPAVVRFMVFHLRS